MESQNYSLQLKYVRRSEVQTSTIDILIDKKLKSLDGVLLPAGLLTTSTSSANHLSYTIDTRISNKYLLDVMEGLISNGWTMQMSTSFDNSEISNTNVETTFFFQKSYS